MKTYKNLYRQIYDFANLYAAWRRARCGKRDRAAVASFEFDLERNLPRGRGQRTIGANLMVGICTLTSRQTG